MKEVKEWNGKPRLMWCWDNSERDKYKGYVVRILTEEEMKEAETNYSVIIIGNCYKHCAEIEEKTERPCTREELIEMLKKQGLPMLKSMVGNLFFMVESISDSNVYICGKNYSYEILCRQYTLLDGTELWVEE